MRKGKGGVGVVGRFLELHEKGGGRGKTCFTLCERRFHRQGATTGGGRLSWLSKVKYSVILTVRMNSFLVFRVLGPFPRIGIHVISGYHYVHR